MPQNGIDDICDIFKISEKDLMEHLKGRKLNVRQAAKMLGVGRRYIYLLVAEGSLVAFRLKSAIRISEKSIIAYIAKKIII